MGATELPIYASGTQSGYTSNSPIYISGTYVQAQGAVQLVLLCALSGLAVIPVRCDSTGRIGSIV
jgi:hypothetical protein